MSKRDPIFGLTLRMWVFNIAINVVMGFALHVNPFTQMAIAFLACALFQLAETMYEGR